MPAFAESAGGLLTDKQIDAITQQVRSRWSRPEFSTALIRLPMPRNPQATPSEVKPRTRPIANPVTAWTLRRAKGQRDHERLLSGAGQRPGTTDDSHHRASGNGGARLARERSRQTDVRPGSHRRSCLARLTARSGPGQPYSASNTLSTRAKTMSNETTLSRRGLFMKLGILFNGFAAAALAVPIGRFLLSSITRGRANGYLAWVSLGRASEFPEGETRLANFRNPLVMPSDGKTVDTACWVRRIEGDQFQVFAVNCAHLGCPVRWFPQSGLFMCPCHGGAYYRDGSRPRVRRSAVCLNIRTKFRTASLPFRRVRCPHQGRVRLSWERNGDAPDLPDR